MGDSSFWLTHYHAWASDDFNRLDIYMCSFSLQWEKLIPVHLEKVDDVFVLLWWSAFSWSRTSSCESRVSDLNINHHQPSPTKLHIYIYIYISLRRATLFTQCLSERRSHWQFFIISVHFWSSVLFSISSVPVEILIIVERRQYEPLFQNLSLVQWRDRVDHPC